MRQLRSACAWKAEQTHTSLTRYLVEEAYETLEAIELGEATGDWSHLREELGDLLLQVYFHGVVAEGNGEFTLDDVARDIHAKMVRRNPHVFAGVDAEGLTPEAINDLWQAAKAREKAEKAVQSQEPARGSALDRLPSGLPALLAADKVLDRTARAGQPLDLTGAAESPDVGDRLLALVAEAAAEGVDPEQALRDALRRRLPPA
ncbi:nucleoside triphosphate pyrophosphohydrolase [Nocardioides daphniae]|nr:nucleoside triphosphate pyrophosphohydrolase [Nocardioides daphniae]